MTTSPFKPGYPDDNPKTAIGISKAPLHFIPPVALVHLGLAMENGGAKYGLMNWRERTVSTSVYYDAIFRHLMAWWDGEDAAPDSGVHHLGHVMACCAIILDAAETTRLNDDRPDFEGFVSKLLERVRRAREEKLAYEAAKREAFKDMPTGDVRFGDPYVPEPEAGLRELAAREAGATPNELFGAPTDKPPADATNDDLKTHNRANLPKPGTPLMRRGLRIKGNQLWFEDTAMIELEALGLHPSQQDRLIALVDAIDGEAFPARWSEVHPPEG